MVVPKFRAWDKQFSIMSVVTRLNYWSKIVEMSDGELYIQKLNEVELMQSTGLLDKKGVEIFEGDIVKMPKDVYSEPTYYKVVRHRGGAYRLESKQHGCELWLRHTDCEIVGNVYENLELIEEMENGQDSEFRREKSNGYLQG